MKKNYFYIASLLFCLFSLTVSAQENKQQPSAIEGLGFYPNPVSSGKIYIVSKTTSDKEVTIFDVLGKKVLQATLNTKELNISSLSPGVYIIKIREGEATATRKLIVR
jgi:Secretion system C-terminal sorting domain